MDKLILKVGERRIELASPFIEYHSDNIINPIRSENVRVSGMPVLNTALRLYPAPLPGVTAIATIKEADFFQALFDHFPGMIAGYKAHLRGEIDRAWEMYHSAKEKALEACEARVNECETMLATLEGDIDE